MPAVGAAIAAVASWLGGAAGVIKAIVAVASIGLGVKQSRDQKKAAKRAQMESNNRNSYRNFRQALPPRRVIYGRARVGGPILFAHNLRSWWTHLVIGIAAHEIDAFEAFHILKDDLTVNLNPSDTYYGCVSGKYSTTVTIWPYTGTESQNIGTRMRSARDPMRPDPADIIAHVVPPRGTDVSLDFITTSDRFAGIAALYVLAFQFGIVWEGQSPDFSATVRGKKVLDPRTGLTAWSANPALCAADYLVSFMDFPWSTIDLDALTTAADICDQAVALKAGGTEPRYQANGILSADASHAENLETLAESMAGYIRYSAGLWIIEAGAAKSPVMALSESMVLGSYDMAIGRTDAASPNAIRGNFISTEEWQPASYPSYQDTAAIAADGLENWQEIDLQLTTSHTTAQRISRIALARARASRSLSIELDLRGLLLRPGDIVTYTSAELGLDSVPFEVDGFAFSSTTSADGGTVLTTRLDLVEYDATAYDWTAATDEQDMVTGTVEIDAIRPKYFQNLTADATVISTSPVFSATAVFTATLPAPSGTVLTTATVELTITITTNDGTSDSTSTVSAAVTDTATDLVSPGIPATVNFTIPSGHTYVSNTIISATTQGTYDNSTTTPLQDATII